MSDITSRKVTRWFFNGKGYASKRGAYEAKAKRLLLDLVLGEVTNHGRSKIKGLSGDEAKARITELFAAAFPHETYENDSPDILCDGCVDGRDSNLCSYYGEERQYEFKYASCKWSQQQWIKAKAAELMTLDGVKRQDYGTSGAAS